MPFLVAEPGDHGEVDISGHPGLSPALHSDAPDETEREPGRTNDALDLDRRLQDRIHLRARANSRCCSTNPELVRRSSGRSSRRTAESNISVWARAVAGSSWRSSASSIACSAATPSSRCRSHDRANGGRSMSKDTMSHVPRTGPRYRRTTCSSRASRRGRGWFPKRQQRRLCEQVKADETERLEFLDERCASGGHFGASVASPSPRVPGVPAGFEHHRPHLGQLGERALDQRPNVAPVKATEDHSRAGEWRST